MPKAKPKSKKRPPTLLNQKRKSAAQEMYGHLPSALQAAGPLGAVLAKGLKGRGRGR